MGLLAPFQYKWNTLNEFSLKMAITYTVASFKPEDNNVEVTYENSEGFVHKRHVNIPKLEDGSIDEDYFNEILEGQLRGVENKIKIGVASFADPNAVEPVGEPDGALVEEAGQAEEPVNA